MSEVRSNELETRLLSSDDLVEVEEDIVASGPREVRAFSALGEECSLNVETPLGLAIGSSFLRGLGFVVLVKRNELVTFRQGRYASMRLLSCVGLDSPSTLSSWSFF